MLKEKKAAVVPKWAGSTSLQNRHFLLIIYGFKELEVIITFNPTRSILFIY